jgi:hypothetical protein
MTKLLTIKQSNKDNKKLVATFCMCKGETKCDDKDRKKVHFGSKGSSTFIDHQDDKKKAAYLKRHKVNENWNNPMTAGALSRFILWNKESLTASISDFKKRFNL